MKENSLESTEEIKNIHFLVHPGFILKFHKRETMPSQIADNLDHLLDSYVEEATKLAPNELMVIFTTGGGEDFVQDFRGNKEDYVEKVRKIKQILGRRAIVLGEQGETWAHKKDIVWGKILSIAKQRGFSLSPQLTAKAYGEYWDACVLGVATNMHRASGMPESRPIKMVTNLTDFNKLSDSYSAEDAKKIERAGTKYDFS